MQEYFTTLRINIQVSAHSFANTAVFQNVHGLIDCMDHSKLGS